MKHNAYIALGSNMGNRLAHLGSALLLLSLHPQVHVQNVSSVYETEPVGYLEQDAFYNMAIHIKTGLEPHDLMQLCLHIEQQLGRVRTIENGPRTIDLDLLYFDDRILQSPRLVLPHPRIQERTFVLVPLVEIAAHFIHPYIQLDNEALLARLTIEGIKKIDFY